MIGEMFPYFGMHTFVWLLIVILHRGQTDATSRDVPVNVVLTSPTATFWIGEQNSRLTCELRDKPIAVYWMKGKSLNNADIIASWYRGINSGPGIEDGTHELDQDYSLVFHRPALNDTGRYICHVSNPNAQLIYNYTDLRVLEPRENMVNTLSSVSGWKGDTVVLPCDFPNNPARVIWNKVTTDRGAFNVTTVLDSWNETHRVIGGERFEWSTTHYALMIRGLEVQDEANFTCVLMLTDDIELSNLTALTVNAHAREPYVRINVCSGGTQTQQCTFAVPHNQSNIELICSVLGAKPPPYITWVDGSFAGSPLNHSALDITEREGVFDTSLTLKIGLDSIEGWETFTCIASGEAVNGVTNQSVIIKIVVPGKEGSLSSGAIIAIIISILVALAIFWGGIFMAFKRKTSRMGPEDANSVHSILLVDKKNVLEDKRNEINNYKPGKFAECLRNRVSCLNIGVFGVAAIGKSAFIELLKCSFLTGDIQDIAKEFKHSSQGTEQRFGPHKLTDHIKLFETDLMHDYDLNYIPNLMATIISPESGNQKQDPMGSERDDDLIHAPILVCELSRHVEREIVGSFVKRFVETSGGDIMVVIRVMGSQEDAKIGRQTLSQYIPRDNIWFFENSTSQTRIDTGKSDLYLQLILECLKMGEMNLSACQGKPNNEFP